MPTNCKKRERPIFRGTPNDQLGKGTPLGKLVCQDGPNLKFGPPENGRFGTRPSFPNVNWYFFIMGSACKIEMSSKIRRTDLGRIRQIGISNIYGSKSKKNEYGVNSSLI